MQKIRLTATGTRALLQHNIRLANPLDLITKQLKVLNAKKKKTDDDMAAIARLEFDGGLYIDSDGPFVPATWLEGALLEAAKATRQGKALSQALAFEEAELPLLYKGPRSPEELWRAGWYDQRMVRIGASRVLRCRPMFKTGWIIEANVVLETALINLQDFEEICERAQMVGIGDYRRQFGKFEIKIEPL